ncbi:MAG: hypothetical protein AB7R67_23755 [Vicinamibacterales bacterium]
MKAAALADAPLTWRVGVDNNFGWLTTPAGDRRLCELHFFWFIQTAELVDLHTGDRFRVAADGTSRWQPIAPAEACAIVELPSPTVDGRAELDRRTDPFHVERHRSTLFIALAGLVRDRCLPVGHALRTLADRQPWDGQWVGACHQAPEVFAAAVNLAMSDGAESIERAVTAVLRDDLASTHHPDPLALLVDCGWPHALVRLPAAIARAQERIPVFARPAGGQLGLSI